MHNPLEKTLRTQLENIVKAARDCAEAGAREAVEVLGVADANAPGHLSPKERELRVRLRAHARQLGDALSSDGRQGITSLVEEIAYEHWHRMLFARFLAENGLLFYEGVAISLEDCRDLAEELHFSSPWELAANCAAKMLPQIFRLDSPSFELTFAPDRIRALERLLDSIDSATFAASDALGWLYQFWQTRRKKEINESEVKIGAKELPAVTQLFTEPYMVSFLLDNSLGAWYAAPKLKGRIFDSEAEAKAAVSTPAIPLQYLRLIRMEDKSWVPAGGTFDKWPSELKDFTLLDPCCGSGHFLVASFLMLVPMRMEREGLDAATAVDKVLTENIHGLELDQRCVELAAFALALEAWRYPDAGGYRSLPGFHLACDGIAPQMKREEWMRLARAAARNLPAASADLIPDDNPSLWESRLLNAMGNLYDTFENAPVLGSLINPEHLAGDLLHADFADVAKILHDNLSDSNAEVKEAVIAAHGIIKAMELLSKKYTLVITNVPYLARGKQSQDLQDFCEKYYNDAKGDLATVFLARCLDINNKGGTSCIVLPQNWLFLTTYRSFREKLLAKNELSFIGRLGAGAFDTISGEIVKAILLSVSNCPSNDNHQIYGLDVSESKSAEEKASLLLTNEIKQTSQLKQKNNPDARIVFGEQQELVFLLNHADGIVGIQTGDYPQFGRFWWEINTCDKDWAFESTSPQAGHFYDGMFFSIFWQDFQGTLARRQRTGESYVRGWSAFGKNGLIVGAMSKLPVALYNGQLFDNNTATIIPKEKDDLLPIWCYCSSPDYHAEVRQIDQAIKVTNATLVKVPFDLDRWRRVAEKEYPHGLPEPFTDDPTQWIFHGHPCASVVWDGGMKQLKIGDDRIDSTVLHVAVARLLGYHWPAELDLKMKLAPEMRTVMKRLETLRPLADEDGIVCIPALRQEQDAATRLLSLLVAAYGDSWEGSITDQLLAACDCEGKSLEQWLRDKFFVQHAKLFGDRPFIWQIWDGLRDGFSVLVN